MTQTRLGTLVTLIIQGSSVTWVAGNFEDPTGQGTLVLMTGQGSWGRLTRKGYLMTLRGQRTWGKACKEIWGKWWKGEDEMFGARDLGDTDGPVMVQGTWVTMTARKLVDEGQNFGDTDGARTFGNTNIASNFCYRWGKECGWHLWGMELGWYQLDKKYGWRAKEFWWHGRARNFGDMMGQETCVTLTRQRTWVTKVGQEMRMTLMGQRIGWHWLDKKLRWHQQGKELPKPLALLESLKFKQNLPPFTQIEITFPMAVHVSGYLLDLLSIFHIYIFLFFFLNRRGTWGWVNYYRFFSLHELSL